MLVTSAQHNEYEGQDTGCVTATIDGVEMSVPKDPPTVTTPRSCAKLVAGELTIQEAD